jgi:hypothetical protein
MTSSTSLQKAMQSCPRPMVYFPLLAPSWASSASCIQGVIYETAGSKHAAQFLLNTQLPGYPHLNLHPFPVSKWIFRQFVWSSIDLIANNSSSRISNYRLEPII